MAKKIKIQIKSRWFVDKVLFEYESEDNTILKTVNEANLRGADLYGANLRGADLYGADLYGANLREADLYGANLRGADLYGANLRGADLYGADLYGANLREADLYGANLRGADLYGANLRGANLRGADLYGANLRGADLYGANLRGADLYGANLRGADLYGANLRGANLRGADLYGANLRGADLYGANLRGADLYGANLREVPFTNLPKNWIDDCSKDILYVMNYLKNEVPHLKKKLLAGEVDGSQYDGDCACLVGSLANAEDKNESETEVRQFCSVIPFYELGTHNPGEQFYLNIKKGDTPKTNEFSKHAIKLCNMVLGLPEDDGIEENAKEEISTIEIDGKKYRKNDVEERLKELPTLED